MVISWLCLEKEEPKGLFLERSSTTAKRLATGGEGGSVC